MKSSYDRSRKWLGITNNFKKLRKKFPHFAAPVIPYLGYNFADLVYIEELHANSVDGKINWEYVNEKRCKKERKKNRIMRIF